MGFHVIVHCRTGSLETLELQLLLEGFVHCRTGSLEIEVISNPLISYVHCRTGSLENAEVLIIFLG